MSLSEYRKRKLRTLIFSILLGAFIVIIVYDGTSVVAFLAVLVLSLFIFVLIDEG